MKGIKLTYEHLWPYLELGRSKVRSPYVSTKRTEDWIGTFTMGYGVTDCRVECLKCKENQYVIQTYEGLCVKCQGLKCEWCDYEVAECPMCGLCFHCCHEDCPQGVV